jgi:hypothetical protein
MCGKTIGKVNEGAPNAAIAKAGDEETNLRIRHEI